MTTDLMPLTMLPLNQPARIVTVHAGRTLQERLAGMGLQPGAQVCVVRDNGGPLLLALGESRVALGRGMAHKILVIPIHQGDIAPL